MNKNSATAGRLLGCALYIFLGMSIVVLFLTVAALGNCPVDDAGRGCEYDHLIKLLMFPGSLIVFLIGGWLLLQRVTKE